MKSVFLSIVIPAYNESNRIVKTLDILSDYLSLQDYSWEIVVANDGRLDSTINEIKGWAIIHPLINVHLIDLMHRGKGAAVRSGMSYATGSFKMMCDADLAMPVDHIDIVHERGNLEFNGLDTVILNWSTIGDPSRNLNYNKQQAELDLKKHFGVTNVIFIEGIPDGDLTKGHIDGIARFIGLRTVVVIQCTTQSLCRPDSKDAEIYDKAAKIIKEAGFNVIREPIEGFVKYNSQKFDTNYMNWLVGNGFVIVPGFGNPDTDIQAKSRIESYFPNRDVHLIEMLSSWAAGGGVHCHTNDQPAFSISK